MFLGVDGNGVPRQAHKRSTTTFGNSFRQIIEGSDTKYSFAHFGKSNLLFVFEAPIDLMSFLTLYPKNWQDSSYIAMNGVYESAVLTALEEHPNIDCRIEKLRSQLNAAFRNGQYRYLAEYALAGSVFFSQKRPPTKTAIGLSHSPSRGWGCYTTPTVTAVEALYFTEI